MKRKTIKGRARTKSVLKSRKAPMTSAAAMEVGDTMWGKNGKYRVIRSGKTKRWQKIRK